MLEAIALAAGYRVGLFSKPHLVHFEERCRSTAQRPGEALPALRGVEAARQIQPDVLRVDAGDHACCRRAAGPVILGRPRRTPRCGQYHRCRLRRDHEHRHRSCRYLGHTRETIGREGRHHARRRRPSSATRLRRKHHRHAAGSVRICGSSAVTTTIRATSSGGVGPGATSATRHRLPACAARTSCSTHRFSRVPGRAVVAITAQPVRQGFTTIEAAGADRSGPADAGADVGHTACDRHARASLVRWASIHGRTRYSA